ncbi:MAG: protein kinase [Leptolyngbyaceae cyanobacterium CRU_2_3]|nr:protein kinase [Leptolyngbyaceae cyanobacterium CRU_2_3]
MDIAIQWAWGLHYAHAQGVIHRAVSPNTLLITPDNAAKVTDFGWTTISAINAIAGMSPAQIHPTLLTPQIDCRGWGLSILEMFAGGRTWAAETPASQVLQDYLATETDDPAEGTPLPQMPLRAVQLLQRCFQDHPEQNHSEQNHPEQNHPEQNHPEQNHPEQPTLLLQQVATELQAVYRETMGHIYPHREPIAPDSTPKGVADRFNNTAVLLWDLGRSNEAVTLWEQALIAQPHHLESIYNRGLMLWRSGKVSDDQALLRHLETSRSANPTWAVDYLLSLVHLERGDSEAALKLLENIQAEGVQQKEITAALATVKQRLPVAKQLLPNFSTRIAPQHPTSPEMVAVTLGAASRYALSGDAAGAIRLWDIPTGKALSGFKGHQGAVRAIAFSPDGCSVLSGGDDQIMQLWNVADTSHIHLFDGRERRATDLYRRSPFSPFAALLGKLDGFTRRLQSTTHHGTVWSVGFSADGRYVVSGGDDRVVKLWDIQTGKCLRIFQGHKGPVLAVQFTPDRQHILSASADQTIKLWEITTGHEVQTFKGHRHLTSIACSADGQYVAASADPLQVWDISTGQRVQSFEMQGSRSVVFTPEGRFILAGGDDQHLRLWEIASGRCLRTFDGHQSGIRAIALSSDGNYALSADATALKWWAIHSSTLPDLAPLRLSQIQLTDPQITSDHLYEQEVAQAQVALAQGDVMTAAQHIRQARSQPGYNRGAEAVQTWLSLYTSLPRQSLNSSWEQVTFERYTEAINSVAFSPDSNCLLTGSADTTLKLWNIQTSRCLLSFEGHKIK